MLLRRTEPPQRPEDGREGASVRDIYISHSLVHELEAKRAGKDAVRPSATSVNRRYAKLTRWHS